MYNLFDFVHDGYGIYLRSRGCFGSYNTYILSFKDVHELQGIQCPWNRVLQLRQCARQVFHQQTEGPRTDWEGVIYSNVHEVM